MPNHAGAQFFSMSDEPRVSQLARVLLDVRAEDTPEGRARLEAYYCALGRFLDLFARVEGGVHAVLRHYAKMSPQAAKALLSGVRVDETKKRLKRLADVGLIEASTWAAMEPIFQQLGIITGARNDILHHGAISIASGNGFVTNAGMALTLERIDSFHISPEILDDMSADLRKIMIHLVASHMGIVTKVAPDVEPTLRAAWRYKRQTMPPGEFRISSRSPKDEAR